MQRREHAKHSHDVLLAEIQLRRLLERLVPRLVPQDRDANQLQRHNLRLLHEQRAVLPQVIEHRHRGGPSRAALRLARDEKRVQERLRVLPADPHEELVDELSHRRRVAVNPRDDLGNHLQPRVDVHVPEPVHERSLHLGGDAVVKPQREQAQDVLKRAAFALLFRRASERDGSKEAGDGRRHVSRRRLRRVLRVVLHRRGVEQRPVMPRLGPRRARVRRGSERGEDVVERGVVHVLGEGPPHLAEFEKRARDEFAVGGGDLPDRRRRAHRPVSFGWGGVAAGGDEIRRAGWSDGGRRARRRGDRSTDRKRKRKRKLNRRGRRRGESV
eukprot:31441-Pelagococcus_subviridis.AAC.8